MSELISKRSELLFLYDVKDINPNGDPLDENKPRIDEETMENLVSDVRLKRTVREQSERGHKKANMPPVSEYLINQWTMAHPGSMSVGFHGADIKGPF